MDKVCQLLSCGLLLVVVILLALIYNKVNTKEGYKVNKLQLAGPVAPCIPAGFNPVKGSCCAGLHPFEGSGGNFCLDPNDPNCLAVCDNEACNRDDQQCVAECKTVCSTQNK